MSQIPLFVRKLLRDEDGVTAVEYALMAATIAVAVVVTVLLLGQQVQEFYVRVQSCIDSPSTC